MRKSLSFGLLLCLSLMLLALGAGRTRAAPPIERHSQDRPPLRVVTKPLEPFVIEGTGAQDPAGFSVDLWQQIAAELGATYEWVWVDTVDEMLNAVQVGDADVAIAGITITGQREARVDFTHGYFDTGLQIMVSAQASNVPLAYLRSLMTSALVPLLAAGALVTLIMAHLIWLFERRHNPDFPRGYLQGVFEGVWWSVAVFAEGIYGESKPTTVMRRLFAIFWIVLGIVLLTQFQAAITSALTVQSLSGFINGPEDLPGTRVIALAGTTGAQWLEANRIQYQPVDGLENAYRMLESDQADALVYDSAVLLNYSTTKGKGKVRVVGPLLTDESYGIALPLGSPLRKTINEVILDMEEDGTYDLIYDEWFSETP